MHNLTDYLAGAGMLLVGIVLGRISRPRRRSAKTTETMCRSCEHGVGHHTDKIGRCRKPVGVLRDPCSCQHYDGPTPMPEYFAPEISA